MKRFHQIFGLLIIIVFLLTGQYMDRYHNHLRGMPDGMRMLYRTRHIFILLSGLVHLGIGTYFRPLAGAVGKGLQILGSVMIASASIAFVIAFFYEPTLADLKTPLSHWGMYLIGVGTLFHFFSGLFDVRDTQ